MADDWKPGDLAMLVKGGRLPCPHNPVVFHTGSANPELGGIYEVSVVRPVPIQCGCMELILTNGRHGIAPRFMKVTPQDPDAFDEEVIEAMKSPSRHTERRPRRAYST